VKKQHKATTTGKQNCRKKLDGYTQESHGYTESESLPNITVEGKTTNFSFERDIFVRAR